MAGEQGNTGPGTPEGPGTPMDPGTPEGGGRTGEAGSEDLFIGENAGGVSNPRSTPYDPEPDREKVRGMIALVLVFLLVAIVAVSFLTLWIRDPSFDNLKGLLELIFAPIIAVVGSATGFYFGSRQK